MQLNHLAWGTLLIFILTASSILLCNHILCLLWESFDFDYHESLLCEGAWEIIHTPSQNCLETVIPTLHYCYFYYYRHSCFSSAFVNYMVDLQHSCFLIHCPYSNYKCFFPQPTYQPSHCHALLYNMYSELGTADVNVIIIYVIQSCCSNQFHICYMMGNYSGIQPSITWAMCNYFSLIIANVYLKD